MKILIVNEFLIYGGTEQSCLKMKKLLSNGNEVVYLNFDKNFKENIQEVEDKKNIISINLKSSKIDKIAFNLISYIKIRKKIKEINPDKIILNNLFSAPITQLRAMKGYDVYQIIRDYYVVCPKSTCIKEDNSICEGYNCNNCLKNCGNTLKMRCKLYQIKKMEKLRKKLVKKVISPSEKLNEYLQKLGYNSCCINNPMEITENSRKNEIAKVDDTRRYVYVGAINEIKGIYKFIDAYNEFSKDKDVELVIIGKCSQKEDEEKIKKILKNNSKIKYVGYKTHSQVIEMLQKFNFIVVPSLWVENYPTTSLEGMLYKCLVLGSNRGGIPEIVGKDRGLLFDILNKNDIIETLEKSYSMNNEEYEKIINNAYEYVINNNSFEKYYERIMRILEK